MAVSPIIAFTAVTFVHESAHALAAIAQGGTLTSFTIVPGDGYYGRMTYSFPVWAQYSSELISLAPYILWLGIASTTAITCGLRRVPRWAAPLAFLWLFVVPILDVVHAGFSYLMGRQNDLFAAFGPPGVVAWVVSALLGTLVYSLAFALQRRIYRAEALSLGGYFATSAIGVGVIVAILTFGPRVISWL